MVAIAELSMEDKVEAVLEEIRPFLREDGGDIHLVGVTKTMIVKVRFSGACTACSMQNSTFKVGVEESILKTIPEVKKVLVVE